MHRETTAKVALVSGRESRRRVLRGAVLGAAVAVAMGGPAARGATGTWTGAADADWSNAGNWIGGVPNANTEDAIFTAPGAANLSLQLSATRAVRSVQFNENAVTTPVTVNIGAGLVLTVQSEITSAGGDHVILGSAPGGGTPEFRLGGSLTVNIAAGSVEINARMNQAATSNQIVKNGAGTLEISGDNANGTQLNLNAATGGFFVNAGTLQLNHRRATGNTGSGVTINNGGTIEFAWQGSQNYNSNNGRFLMNDGATLRSAAGGFNRGISNGNGSLTLSGGMVTIDVVDGTFTIGQDIVGAGGFRKIGTGTLVIDDAAAPNTYSGNTVIADGTVRVGGSGTFGNSPVIELQANGKLDLSTNAGWSPKSFQTLGGVGHVTTAANLSNGTVAPGLVGAVGTLSFDADLTLSGARLALDLSNPAVTGEVLAVAGALNVASPTLVNINRVGGALAAGTYTIATYGSLASDAATTTANLLLPQVRQGLALVNPATTPGSLQVTAGAGSAASLVWTGGANGQWDRTLGNFTNGGSADRFFDWDDVAFSGGGPANVDVVGTLVPDDVTFSGGTNYSLTGSGTLNAVQTLTKSGTSTVTIGNSGNNSIVAVNVTQGTLVLANPGSTSYTMGSAAVASGGTLRTVGSTANAMGTTTVAAGGVVELGDGSTTGTIGNVANAGTVRYNVPDGTTLSTGAISGTGTVTKVGNGTVTVPATAVHTYTGNTVVNAGTLRVTTSSSLGAPGSGTVTVPAGSAIDLSGNATANQLDFGQKVFEVAGTGPFGGGVIVNDGVAQQNALERVTLTGNATLGGSQRFDIRAGQVGGVNVAALNLNGNTLTKIGGNQFSLVATDVSDGNIQANQGVLAIESSSSVPDFGTGRTITYNGATAQFFANTVDVNGQSFVKRPMVVAVDTVMGNASNTAATIGSPITLNGSIITRALNADGTGTFTLQGNISGPGGILKENNGIGTNTLVLAGDLTYTGATQVVGGTVTMSGNASGSASLNVGDGTVVQSTVGAVRTLRFGSVNLNGSGRLDVADDRLVIGGAMPVSTLLSYINRGRNNGTWDGAGLMSVAAQGSTIRGIGWAVAGDAGIGQWGSATGLAATDIVVRMTYLGDLDLDGVVDPDDYALIDRQVARNGIGAAGDWIDGDVNYDGVVNSGDYLLMDTAYGQQTGVLSPALLAAREAQFGSGYVASLVAAVPEPSAVASVVALAAAGMARRRRRSA